MKSFATNQRCPNAQSVRQVRIWRKFHKYYFKVLHERCCEPCNERNDVFRSLRRLTHKRNICFWWHSTSCRRIEASNVLMTNGQCFFKPFFGVKMTHTLKFCNGTLHFENQDMVLPCIKVKRFGESGFSCCTRLLQLATDGCNVISLCGPPTQFSGPEVRSENCKYLCIVMRTASLQLLGYCAAADLYNMMYETAKAL